VSAAVGADGAVVLADERTHPMPPTLLRRPAAHKRSSKPGRERRFGPYSQALTIVSLLCHIPLATADPGRVFLHVLGGLRPRRRGCDAARNGGGRCAGSGADIRTAYGRGRSVAAGFRAGAKQYAVRDNNAQENHASQGRMSGAKPITCMAKNHGKFSLLCL
jgi:hypothetical protein